jgi:hypothetical protein
MSKHLTLVLTLFTFIGFGVAQNPHLPRASKPDPAAEQAARQAQLSHKVDSPDATSNCSYTFTTGTGQNFLQSCVTVNGNVVEFQSPESKESIRVGSYGEGYGFCDFNSNVAYYDYADYGDSGNWLAPTTVSHNATSAKIVRTTSDGIWTLTQTITQVAGTASVKVSMALKNNTGIERAGLLLRWVDADADSTYNNNWGSTSESAFAWNTYGYGLVMQSVAPWTYLEYGYVNSGHPNPCDTGASIIDSPVNGDYGMFLLYFFSSVPKNATKTVALTYKTM